MLSWPYALAQQLDLTPTVPKEVVSKIHSFVDDDIVITFNTRFDWSFGQQQVAQESYDFNRIFVIILVILAVEITKALGFDTSLFEYKTGAGELFVIPKLMELETVSYLNYIAQIKRLYYISPWDSLVYRVPSKSLLERCLNALNCKKAPTNVVNSVAEIGHRLEELQNPIYRFSHVLQLLRIPSFRESARILTEIFKSSKTLVLNLGGGKSLKLDTNVIGRSHHSYFSTSEFLMTPNTTETPGISLKDLMNRHGMNGIYGPLTLTAMERIGWPVKKNPQIIRLRSEPTPLPTNRNQ